MTATKIINIALGHACDHVRGPATYFSKFKDYGAFAVLLDLADNPFSVSPPSTSTSGTLCTGMPMNRSYGSLWSLKCAILLAGSMPRRDDAW
jgi:hypothetical protein